MYERMQVDEASNEIGAGMDRKTSWSYWRGLRRAHFRESHLRPKPMIEIGGKPILWHIMKMYSSPGLPRFHHLCRLQATRHQGILR